MNVDLSDKTQGALIAVGGVAVLLFFCYALVGNFRESKRTHEWINLHRPLLPSTINLRLDAARRDAEDGFNACDACDFENLKRNIFCTLCGSPLDATKKKSRRAKDKLHVQRQLASASDNRRRQARALRRKEWTRRLDGDGKLCWFHDARVAGAEESARVRTNGYVVQFQGDPPVVAHEEEEDTREEPEVEEEESCERQPEMQHRDGPADGHVAITINAEAATLPPDRTSRASEAEASGDADAAGQAQPKAKLKLLSLDEIHARLADELASRPMAVVDAASADPGRPAVLISKDSEFREEPKALVDHSQLNFPSKIAEFVTRTSTALMLSEQSLLKVNITRDQLLEDSIEALAVMPQSCCRCPIRMSFNGEQGIDAGGVYREWLVLVHEQLASSTVGVFKCVDSRDRSFYLNPTSSHDIGEHHLTHFFSTGRLLGRMLLEGNVTGFHLALPLLKIIVGQPVTFSDLEYFDPEAYKNLRWLLDNDGVDALGLDFTVTEVTAKGDALTVELIPGGHSVEVNDANKLEYVDCKLKYLLFDSVATQLFAFLKGLYEVMPPEMLMLFDAEELDYVLSGSDEIDVDDWERNTKYTEDLVEHPVREWFWALVREMPNEYRQRLLLFSTGSSRVPLAGFAALTSYDGRLCPFMLNGVGVEEAREYIHSHACFNRLDLPRYAKKKDLKAVLYAVLDTDTYGFTTA